MSKALTLKPASPPCANPVVVKVELGLLGLAYSCSAANMSPCACVVSTVPSFATLGVRVFEVSALVRVEGVARNRLNLLFGFVENEVYRFTTGDKSDRSGATYICNLLAWPTYGRT